MVGVAGGENSDMVQSNIDISESSTERRESPPTRKGSPIRLLVLGSHGVGKSAITVRYLTRRFIGEYRSQVDIIYRQTVQLDGLTVDLEIIDISTQPGDETLPTLEICQCDCYLVVYSVADKGTFISANQLLSAILKLRPQFPHPPITLLGNKQDLEHSREVSVEEGSHAAQVFGCAFKEVSVAENSEAIVPVFSSLIRRTQALRLIHIPEQTLPGTTKAFRCPSSDSCCNHKSCKSCASCNLKNRSSRCSSLRLDIQAANSRRDRVKRILDNGIEVTQNKDIMSPTIGKLETNVVKHQLAKSEMKKSLTKSFSSSLPRHLVPKIEEPILIDEKKFLQDDNQNLKLYTPKLSRKTSENIRTRANTTSNNKSSNRYKKMKQPTICSDSDQSDQECSSHSPVCQSRSFSSPECSCLLARNNLQNNNSKCLTHNLNAKKQENLISSKRLAAPGSLLSRGRSFVVDSGSRYSQQNSSECSCQIPENQNNPNRQGSFKSSGKLEIVTVQNSKTNSLKNNGGKNLGNDLYKEYSLPFNYRSHSPKPNSKPNSNVSDGFGFKPLQHTPHTRSLRLLKPFSSDSHESSSCTSPDEACSPSSRQRKFSVFGNFRALGNLLSNGSMPDLPSAKANLTDRFGSIKNVFKKRSV